MARWKHKNSSWVSTYDSDLDRWVSWDEMKEDWYREHQARRQFPNLNHPMFWIMESNALHRSALCLWKEGDASPDGPLRLMEYQKVGMMLGGMSIECAIKAQWISKFRFPIDPDQQKKVFSGAHNLVSLAASAGFRTNARDRKVLSHLSDHIRWLGRYPTPKTIDEFVRHTLTNSFARDEDWKAYISFREKLGTSVSRAIRRWQINFRRAERSSVETGKND